MNETVAIEQQSNSVTQTLVKEQVLKYTPQPEKLFQKEISDDALLPNVYIINWDLLSVIPPVQKENKAEDAKVLELGKRYFEANKKDLLKKYQNKYIAILNDKVVGSDKDFSKLAERIYKKFGYQTIYMPFVSEQKRIVKIPSPRIGNL